MFCACRVCQLKGVGPSLAAYGKLVKGGSANLSPEDKQVLTNLFANFSPAVWPSESGIAETAGALVEELIKDKNYTDLTAHP